jgi:hypothetical protein
MSLKDWVQYGWLSEHQSSRNEVENLLGLVDRDLRESQAKGLGADWSFAIAHNAALQAVTAALAAAGYRASRDAHHYRVFQSLEYTIKPDPKLIRSLDAFRKKRDTSSYEMGGTISDKEADEMANLAKGLHTEVERWIRTEHPELL